jgi:hypothetical protein
MSKGKVKVRNDICVGKSAKYGMDSKKIDQTRHTVIFLLGIIYPVFTENTIFWRLLRLRVKPTQLGPGGRAIPYLDLFI